MLLSNRTYDQLKWVAQILLPALGTLYFALGNLWGFPRVEEVVGTITAVDVFLGVLLGISSSTYENSAKYDGAVIVNDRGPDAAKLFSIELHKEPEEIETNKDLVLRVKNAKSQ